LHPVVDATLTECRGVLWDTFLPSDASLTGCRPASANDACRVNPVETRFIASPLSQSRRVNAVQTHGRASLQTQSQTQTQPAPVSVSHDTPPAPSQEGKGEAVDATEEGARCTYMYTASLNHASPLLWRGVGGEVKCRPTPLPVVRLPLPL
ncbi:MAG: hypothetical protein LBD27_05460, partial [Tannerella sp.]|nr:hypothetical protein [Tannerella sp.]